MAVCKFVMTSNDQKMDGTLMNNVYMLFASSSLQEMRTNWHQLLPYELYVAYNGEHCVYALI